MRGSECSPQTRLCRYLTFLQGRNPPLSQDKPRLCAAFGVAGKPVPVLHILEWSLWTPAMYHEPWHLHFRGALLLHPIYMMIYYANWKEGLHHVINMSGANLSSPGYFRARDLNCPPQMQASPIFAYCDLGGVYQVPTTPHDCKDLVALIHTPIDIIMLIFYGEQMINTSMLHSIGILASSINLQLACLFVIHKTQQHPHLFLMDLLMSRGGRNPRPWHIWFRARDWDTFLLRLQFSLKHSKPYSPILGIIANQDSIVHASTSSSDISSSVHAINSSPGACTCVTNMQIISILSSMCRSI